MQKGTTIVELTGEELALTLTLPAKYDPARAWPLLAQPEGESGAALALRAAPKFLEKAIAWAKAHYPVALAEGEKAQETALTVEVTGLRNTKGSVVYSIFSGPDGFPDKGAKALASGSCAITDDKDEKTARFVVPKLAPGVYAVTLFHDENSNGKLDTKTFGIPKEGFGFSNDPKIRMGPPRFKDTSFAITGAGPERIVRIKVVHL
jgi:uncharacterized protein (DUF2141 family)